MVLRTNSQKAFTLVELLVSVGIFALMTALVVIKYGNFNQSVLLTNLAYDVALTIRTAQTYGLSVKSADDTASSYSSPTYAYGVDLAIGTKDRFVLFADRTPNTVYDSGEEISTYMMKRGAVISGVCAANSSDCTLGTTGTLTLLFKRPDPQANICLSSCGMSMGKVELKATDGGVRTVIIRKNGQISVSN
jgi:prepilin-type N-terminal cleavage/methylation domain-containing protein